MIRTFSAAGMLIAALNVTAPASAAAIVIKGVSASTSYPTYDAANAIDGNVDTDWASLSQGNNSRLIVDLGSLYQLDSGTFIDRISSGGANGPPPKYGTTDFTTAFSFATCADSLCSSIGPALNFTKQTPTVSSVSAFTFDANLTGLTGRYFLYSVTAANGSNPGLSELSLTGSAVPEPATWAMLLLGFGLIGFAMRKRSNVRTTVSYV
jgi:hypothetical protein